MGFSPLVPWCAARQGVRMMGHVGTIGGPPLHPVKTDTLVVGAGLAGLCVARSLIERGRDVLVVEARPRVGGRLFPVSLDNGISADLGGQWHGPGQQRIIALAAELGVESYKTHTSGKASYEFMGRTGRYGGAAPLAESLGFLGAIWGSARLSRLARNLERQTGWQAPLPELQNKSLGEWIDRHVCPNSARHLLRFMFQGLFCCSPDDVSLLLALYCLAKCESLEHMVGIDGGCQERQFIGGTQALIESLSRALKPRILLEMPVARIEQDSTGALVSGRGFRIHASRVVVTIPPPLSSKIEFVPELPSERKDALSRLTMGSVVKCILLYDRPFWREKGLSGEMWSGTGPLTGTYDTSVPGSKHGMLTGLAAGPHAVALAALMPEHRRQLILSSLLPHFGSQAGSPLEYRDQVWSDEPWTQGGYSAHLGAADFTPAFCSRHEPFGVLHWAGTETAASWPGYMEGAIESSERVVREVTGTTR